jgi:hypothetical protein
MHRHLKPATGGGIERSRSHIELLLARLAALGSAIERVEGLRRLRLAGEQLLQRRLAAGACAGETPQRLVAVDDGAAPIDDLQPAVQAIRDRLDDIGLGDALAQAQETRPKAEQEKHPAGGQERQQPKPERLDDAAGAKCCGTEPGNGQQHQDENDGSGASPCRARRHRKPWSLNQCLDSGHPAES